jgi:hypothetical protein
MVGMPASAGPAGIFRPCRALRVIWGWDVEHSMGDQKDPGATARRRFLGTFGLGAGVAVAAPSAAFNVDGGTGGLAPAKESEAEKRKPRYRETDHVRAFYRTNRY